MRWSIIRLIWLRELRDQLRDRRTVFMIVGLPLVLYPALGIIVLTFALHFFETPSVIGVVAPESEKLFPPHDPSGGGVSPFGAATLVGHLSEQSVWAGPLSRGTASKSHLDYPPLINGKRWCGPTAVMPKRDLAIIDKRFKIVWLAADDTKSLPNRDVDIILRASEGFYHALTTDDAGVTILERDEPPRGKSELDRPTITVEIRPDDDHSRQALMRLRPLLDRWKNELKKIRFVRKGIDAAFDEPFKLEEPRHADSSDPEKIADLVIRIFPFMLVMWSLAGALYPAVDLCAGEKERGTMETLLISPAGREEIVLGKFLTIWVFSAASALLNLLSMGLTTWQFSAMLPTTSFPMGAIFWCIILSLPLSALFSAISLAIGAYARSSKEGQYYLMPMFLLTMPLVFLTLAPGVELNPVYSLIPVTGVALLMQKLMTSPSLATAPWLYFIPVLAPIAIYSTLALRWAIDQFQREEVLFREAERLDVSLWLRRLLREKDVVASTGQAFFCFALLLFLKWMSFGVGANLTVYVQSAIDTLAFVIAPVVLMAIMLTRSPLTALTIATPRRNDIGLATVLAILVVPPIIWGASAMLADFPQLQKLLESPQSFARDHEIWRTGSRHLFAALLVFAVLPAIGEELAFRGFILNGLRKRYRARTTVFLSAFMGAFFHMNVFAFIPVFLIGLVLGLVTIRSRSIVPAMLFHFCSKAALLLSEPLARILAEPAETGWTIALLPVAIVCCAIIFSICVWLYRRKLPD